MIRQSQACFGAGVAIIDDAHPRITHNLIEHNVSPEAACSYVTYGGGMYIGNSMPMVVENNQFEHNVSGYGGGIAVLSSAPGARIQIERDVIASNTADGPGGRHHPGGDGRARDQLPDRPEHGLSRGRRVHLGRFPPSILS